MNSPASVPERYRRALAVLDEVVYAAPPMTWEDPTYRQPLTIRDLLGRVIASQWAIQRLAGGSSTAAPVGVGTAPEDPIGEWERARDASLAALTPAALDRTIEVDGRTQRLTKHLDTRGVVELLAYAWDLAHAADVGTTFEPDLAGYALDVARRDRLDAAVGQGPQRTTTSQEPIDRLVAYLGRDVDGIVGTNAT